MEQIQKVGHSTGQLAQSLQQENVEVEGGNYFRIRDVRSITTQSNANV